MWTAEGFAELTEQMRSAARPGAPDAGDRPLVPGLPPGVLRQRLRLPAGHAGPDRHPAAAARSTPGLTRECVVIGADTRLEMWDAAAWADYLAGAESAFSASGSEAPPGSRP